MIKVLALMGSPRTGQNTDTLCDAVLEGAESSGAVVEKITVSKLRINPCTACYQCAQNGTCIIPDDGTQLYAKYDSADCIVVASPIYFQSVSAQLKTVIDRCQALWVSKYISNNPLIDRQKLRLGVFVATAGVPTYQADFSVAREVVGSFFKAINSRYWGELLIANTDRIPIQDQTAIVEKARELGQRLVSAYPITESG